MDTDTEIKVEDSSFDMDESGLGISSTESDMIEINHSQIQGNQLKEIEDDGDDGYVIMARPEECPPEIKPELQHLNYRYSDNSSEDDNDTGSSDSDTFKIKRPKVKVEKPPKMPTLSSFQANPKKKWDIWSVPLQEEILTESLGNFGVDLDPSKMDRSVESYNYKLGYMYNKERNESLDSKIFSSNDFIKEKFDKKRPGNKRKSVKERLGRRKKSNKLIYTLQKLKVSPDSDSHVIAKDIADGLLEEKDYLISRVVEVFGKKRAIELYNQTRTIEADGGMLVVNQSRRRTPGGVFLKLVANDEHVDQEKIKEIFNEEHKAQNIKRKKLVARKRRNKTKAVKEQLITNGLLNNDLSDLLIKTDLPDENSLAVKVELPEEINDEQTLTNPPPSPATDQDTPPPPRDQDFLTYSDVEEDSDCLEIETEMDLL